MAGPSIEVTGLTKMYGEFAALLDLTIRLEGSKCVGFLGPNGAGKTTTLKLLTDMIFPTGGTALLNGVDVHKDRKRALERCGALIESPEIYPSLTPREALSLVAEVRGVPAPERKGRIEEVLSEVKMSEWIDKKVGKFSKGMKQRVNIAATLVSDPSIVMLDEPSTGLDPRGMAEVRDIIRGLKRNNRLVFFSSHILSEVTEVCDEVALINRGKLLFHDTIEVVQAKYAADVPQFEVSFARPTADADIQPRLEAIDHVESFKRISPTVVRIGVTGGKDGQASVFEAIAALGVGANGFRESGSSLEQIYMQQIQKGDQ